MVALVVSSALAYGAGLIATRWHMGNIRTLSSQPAFSRKELWQMSGIIFAATLAIALYNNVDIILAKFFLSATEAGLYSGMSVMGRVVTYGALSLVIVMVPLVSASNSSANPQSGRLLGLSLAGVSAITLPIVLFFVAFPESAIRLLVGSQYLEVSSMIGWYGLGMYFFTVATVFVQYFVASHNHQFVYPLAFAILILIGTIGIFHQSLQSITLAYAASGIILFGVMTGTYCYSRLT